MFDSLKLRSTSFESLKLRLINFSGHKNVKHLVGKLRSHALTYISMWILRLRICERANRESLPATRRNCNSKINPAGPFPILEPQNPWIDEFHVVQECHATDFKTPKLWKGRSGSASQSIQDPVINGRLVKKNSTKTAIVYPTDLFATLQLYNLSLDVTELHEISRSPDFQALEWIKGGPG